MFAAKYKFKYEFFKRPSTYIDSIQLKDDHPIQLDIDKQPDGPLAHILHSFHKDCHPDKDFYIDFEHKLCCQGTQSHGYILLF